MFPLQLSMLPVIVLGLLACASKTPMKTEPNNAGVAAPENQNAALGPSIQFDTKGIDFKPWARDFVARVRRNWFVPVSLMTEKGRVVVTFYVHKGGTIADVVVLRPSSVAGFNDSARYAILRSSPVAPLPPEYPDERVFFTVTFYFNESPTGGNQYVADAGRRESNRLNTRSTWMNDLEITRTPPAFKAILAETDAVGFNMVSEPKVGALLSVLAASKPAGRFLELGTGTGHGTAWLLSGMDSKSTLDSVDADAKVVAVAQRHLGSDRRVTFHIVDAAEFIRQAPKGQFDLIYADAWPGKFSQLEETLALLRPGGIYLIDDLLPQPNWPEGHAAKVPVVIKVLEGLSEFTSVKLAWASGLMVVVRRTPS